MELTEKQAYWKRHLDALASFDGTTAEYARKHKLEVKKLYVYKTALRERGLLETETTTSSFVRVTKAQAIAGPGVTVSLPNGVRLLLPDLDAPGLLERLAAL